MKKIVTTALLTLGCMVAFAQTKPCKNINADLDKGTVNGLKPSATMDEVKKKLPCFTGESAETEDMNCGGGVFYLNDNIYFYTGREYIEMRTGFTGKTEPSSLLGTYRDEVTSRLGKAERDIDNGRVLIYKKPYGALRVKFDDDDKCIEVAIHGVAPDKVIMCE